jgi:hypothetical protein
VKGGGKTRTRTVKGHGGGRIAIAAHARGLVGFVMEKPARVRVRLPMPIAIVRAPDGREVRLTKPSDFLALGKVVRPHAHMLAGLLMMIAATKQRKAGEFDLLNFVACLLLALPRSKRGRPRMASTSQALDLAVAHSVRKAAQLIAKGTGENPETVRDRLRAAKRRARKGENKFG